jgi:hypothetical protein
VAEGGGLLNRCRGLNLYPGFESLPHRQLSPRIHWSFLNRARRCQYVTTTLIAGWPIQQPDRRVEGCGTEVHVALGHRQIRMPGELLDRLRRHYADNRIMPRAFGECSLLGCR